MSWRLLLSFAAGAILILLVPELPSPWVTAAIGAAALALLRYPKLRPLGCALLGACWTLLHASWAMGSDWPETRAGEEIEVSGRIVGLPELHDQSMRFVLNTDRHGDSDLPRRIRVSWFRPADYLEPGQRWRMTLRLQPPHGRLNPSSFDYRRYLLANRIGALGTVADSAQPLSGSGLTGVVHRLRLYLAEVLQAEIVDLDAAALARALAIADRSGMNQGLSERLRHTGTAHLLAISGLHIGMVASLAGWVCGWLLAPLMLLSSSLDRRRLAVTGAVVAAAGYALLAGFTLPTQRALVMLAVAGGALAMRRGIQPGNALLMALVAVLVLDPLAPLASGFWLSFAAVGVLIWAFAWRPASGRGARAWVGGLLRAQLIIAVGMLPLNVGLFQQLIPIAPVANLIAIPMVGLWILPGLLTGVGLILLGLPANAVLGATEFGLTSLLAVLEWLHELEFGHVVVSGADSWWALAIASFGALWLLAPPGWPLRWLGALALLPLLWPKLDRPASGELRLDLLDVGSGLAIVVGTAEETLVYDTGPGDGEGGDVLGRLLPGVLDGRRPDRTIISHGHRAHAGGVGSLADEWDPGLVYSSVSGLGRPCTSGQRWDSGGYTFRILHPSSGLPYLEGNSSCVLHIEGPGGSILLPGGIDATVEERLLLTNPDLRAQALVVSASGHRRASSEAFIDQLRPELAMISAARFDRFGRPHGEVIKVLEAADVDWTSTGQCGAITLRLVPGRSPAISSRGGKSRRFWHYRPGCP
jgi:competence protein ComEC